MPAALHIAVFRALQVGDMLCAVPALRALRRLHGHAHITLIGLPWAHVFQRRFRRYLDDFIGFPGYPGLPERVPDLGAIPQFLADVHARGFDLAIQLHGSGQITNPLIALLAPKRAAGFFVPGQWCPDPEWFCPYPDREHEIRRNLRLVQHLGAAEIDESLEFPLEASDWRELAEYPHLVQLPRGAYACVHPGAREARKRWPPVHFARVADALAAQGLEVVLTGSATEQPLTASVMREMRAPAIDAACDISLGGLAALLSGARVLVSNDTGVAHLGVALRVPSVSVFFATDPVRWAPLDRCRHKVVFNPEGVEADAVIELANLVLKEQQPAAQSLPG